MQNEPSKNKNEHIKLDTSKQLEAAKLQHKPLLGPLGLFGFGLTTLLLNLHNLGLYELNSMIIAMGIAFGGLAQLIAGIFEFKLGNTFSGTVFVCYGAFWWSLVLTIVNPMDVELSSGNAMGSYFLAWGLLTLILLLCTLKHDNITTIVFFTLTALFVLLAVASFTNIRVLTVLAGVVGVLCATLAIYGGAAQLANAEYGKEILPH